MDRVASIFYSVYEIKIKKKITIYFFVKIWWCFQFAIFFFFCFNSVFMLVQVFSIFFSNLIANNMFFSL